MLKMSFYLLASGSKGNSFLLKYGDRKILVDCGTTKKYLTSCFEKLNLGLDDIDLLLITHDHSDHISQLNLFKNIPVYTPVALKNRLDAKRVEAFKYFYVDDLKIIPLPLSHDASNTTGYIFESPSEKLVYITDTGYINTSYIGLLYNPDYIVIESNHDVEMLMKSQRPQYIKSRIYSDSGHLCNEDCATTLEAIVTKRTKKIILAHISHEANTKALALKVNINHLIETKKDDLNENLKIVAAPQFEIVSGGSEDEEVDICNSLALNMEWINVI